MSIKQALRAVCRSDVVLLLAAIVAGLIGLAYSQVTTTGAYTSVLTTAGIWCGGSFGLGLAALVAARGNSSRALAAIAIILSAVVMRGVLHRASAADGGAPTRNQGIVNQATKSPGAPR